MLIQEKEKQEEEEGYTIEIQAAGSEDPIFRYSLVNESITFEELNKNDPIKASRSGWKNYLCKNISWT